MLWRFARFGTGESSELPLRMAINRSYVAGSSSSEESGMVLRRFAGLSVSSASRFSARKVFRARAESSNR